MLTKQHCVTATVTPSKSKLLETVILLEVSEMLMSYLEEFRMRVVLFAVVSPNSNER
jgi:hypothetical protein